MLEEQWEIIRWVVSWDFWQWVLDTLRGKAVVTAVAAVITTVLSALSDHPLVTAGATGGCLASSIIIIWDWLQNRNRNQPLPRFIGPQGLESTSFAIPVEIVSSIQHDMLLSIDAYRTLVTVWNRFWQSLRSAKRKHRDALEWQAVRTTIGQRESKALSTAMETLERRLDSTLTNLRAPFHATVPSDDKSCKSN